MEVKHKTVSSKKIKTVVLNRFWKKGLSSYRPRYRNTNPKKQWLPKGICQESAFNCFIAGETDSLQFSGIRPI